MIALTSALALGANIAPTLKALTVEKMEALCDPAFTACVKGVEARAAKLEHIAFLKENHGFAKSLSAVCTGEAPVGAATFSVVTAVPYRALT